ncbi:hypothetical protein ACWGOQ_0016590 [Aquimarina sp. M1]
MKKQSLKIKFRIFILCFTVGMIFTSCSGDDDGDSNSSSDAVELPTNLLGTYTGGLIATDVDNDLGTATLVESGSRVYTINFSDNVTSITNIIFTDIGNGTSFIFTDTDRGIVVTCDFSESESTLGVIKSSDPIISFGGEL